MNTPLLASLVLLSTGMSPVNFCTFFNFQLTSAQIVPPGDAVGSATVAAGLCEDHRFSGVARLTTAESVTAIQIHSPAGPGEVGPVLFSLPLPVDGYVALDMGPLAPDVEGMLIRQELYMDVHTVQHPDGAFGGIVRVEVAVASGSWSSVKQLYK